MTSHYDGGHAAAGLAAADGRGDGDDANNPPGCIEVSLQSNRKRDPPWLLAGM
jgi:hypothetical protein